MGPRRSLVAALCGAVAHALMLLLVGFGLTAVAPSHGAVAADADDAPVGMVEHGGSHDHDPAIVPDRDASSESESESEDATPSESSVELPLSANSVWVSCDSPAEPCRRGHVSSGLGRGPPVVA
jgi:hypothetical protein